MGLFNVGVIGFEPMAPCSQSRVLTVYFSMRDSISDGFTVTLPSFAIFAYVGESSCNRLMGML